MSTTNAAPFPAHELERLYACGCQAHQYLAQLIELAAAADVEADEIDVLVTVRGVSVRQPAGVLGFADVHGVLGSMRHTIEQDLAGTVDDAIDAATRLQQAIAAARAPQAAQAAEGGSLETVPAET